MILSNSETPSTNIVHQMKNLILFILIGIHFTPQAQNLIRNGGFESNYSPPWWAGQYYLCDDWGSSTVWGSPDYYHLDGYGDSQLPNAYASTVLPFEGSAVMGIFLYESHPSVKDFREYLNQELEEPLVIGQHYQLSFYVTNGSGPVTYGGYGCDQFSVAFSTKQLFQPIEDNTYLIDFEPQFTYEGILYNNDWQLITYSFVADSAYKHITFGSFVNDSIQNIQLFDEPSGSVSVNYYIDGVSLETTTRTKDQTVYNDDIRILPNPVSDHFIIDFNQFTVDQVFLYDMNGRIVFQTNVNQEDHPIRLSPELVPGVYIAKLIGDAGQVGVTKFVRQE